MNNVTPIGSQSTDQTTVEFARVLMDKGLTLIRLSHRSKVPLKNELWQSPDYGRGLTPDDFRGINIGIKCGEPLPGGGFLVAIDVDPRNGGTTAWKYLCEELDIDESPETMTTQTGSGGFHFMFRSPERIPKCKLGNGIDIQGEGSYVCGPGSVHENGKTYVLQIDDQIEPIPPKLLSHILSQVEGRTFDESCDHYSERTKVGMGERDDFLTKVAGGMRRAGLGFDEILSGIRLTNSKKVDPPLPEKDLVRIAKSVSRYAPSDPSPAELTPLEASNSTGSTRETSITKKLASQRLSEIYDTSEGLVREIADTILEHSDRKYSHFAIASSLSIIATCAQGGHIAPSLGTGRSSAGLSAYFWLIAPSAAGKDAYRHSVETYLRAVDPRLVFDRFGSNYGLRSSLFCSNSGVSVIDEFQDELDRLGGSKASTYLMQVLTEMKELTNDLRELRPVVLSKTRYPGVKFPRYSIFALGTMEGFLRQLTGDLIGGGLISRFSVWPILDVPSRVFQERLSDVPDTQVRRLVDIFNVGLTEHGAMQDPIDELKRFHNSDKESDVEHIPQHMPHFQMRLEPQAKLMAIEFYHSQEKRYMAFLKQRLCETDVSPGSIADRAPRFALKCASWHSLGRGSPTVSPSDMRWGILVAKTLSDWLCDIITANAGHDPLTRACSKIMSVLSSEKKTKTQIHHGTSRNMTAKLLHSALETLVSAGEVHVYAKGSDKPLDIDGSLPNTRGLTFSAADAKMGPK